MREDMAKVIVERPRRKPWRHALYRGAWKQIPWDEQPKGVSMKRQWRNRKSLNENLRPLFRFINSKVGLLWNDVLREIRERINMDSAVQFHIWQHVKEYVCQIPRENQQRWEWFEFYVDEETGVLTRNKAARYWGRVKSKEPTVFKTKDGAQFRRIGGAWKKVLLKAFPKKDWDECWDAYFKQHCGRVGLVKLEKTYGPGRFAVAVLPVSETDKEQIRTRSNLQWD